MCDYELNSYNCPHPSLANSNYCIFHENESKDNELFERELEEFLDQTDSDCFEFIGFVFPQESSTNFFKDRTISKKILFQNAIFVGDVTFEGTKFAGGADFAGVGFPGKTDFSRSVFLGIVNFNRTVFSTNTKFDNTKFSEFAGFVEAEFRGHAFFRKATFIESVDFYGTLFEKSAKFGFARFEGGVGFSNAKFSEEVLFLGAEFTMFSGFGGAEFTKNASFHQAKFLKEVKFSESSFLKNADFTETVFQDEAGFNKTIFEGKADFTRARFFERVQFFETQYVIAFFTKAEFLEYCTFENTSINKELLFNEVRTEKPEKVSFKNMGLENVSFLNTDVTSFNFVNVKWRLIRKLKFINRWSLYDEYLYAEDEDKFPLIERQYRQIKKNCDSNKDYGGAGDFRIGEMQMRLKRLSGKNIDFYALLLYKYTSYYGESWGLAFVLVIFLVFVLFPILYMFLGLEISSTGSTINYSLKWGNMPDIRIFLKDYVDALAYSLKTIALQKPEQISTAGTWDKITSIIQSVVGPTIIALFLLALRRRFR